MRVTNLPNCLIAVVGFGLGIFATPLSATPQEAEPYETTGSQDYGDGIATAFPDYTGEEIRVEAGNVIFYRVSDPYDEYEAAEGSNAVFIDMKSGKTQHVLPENSDKMLFFLSVIYDEPRIITEDTQMRGIGYVARVGTREDYKSGRLDMIVGRFSDLEQRQIYESVRFVDSPTHVGGPSISMIVWPEDMEARFTEIDLTSFSVTKSEKIDLPKPVEIIGRPCSCAVGEVGENFEVYSPWEKSDEAE